MSSINNTAVGAGIQSSTYKVDETKISDHLVRYAFNPLLRIDLSDRNMTGAMSKLELISKRISNFRDCAYKVRDESSDVLLDSQIEVESVPLRTAVNTAKSQADYLYSSYGDKGVVILEAMTGLSDKEAVDIEKAVLPTYYEFLIDLTKYLSNKSEVNANILKAKLSPELTKIARNVAEQLKVSCEVGLKFATLQLDEAKSEIINARNGKAGKSSHDPSDLYMYQQTGIPALKERDVEFANAERVANQTGNAELAEAIKSLASAVSPVSQDNDKVASLEKQLEEMKAMIASLASKPTEENGE